MLGDIEAIVVEYDDCLFRISHLKNRRKTWLNSTVGHINDYWSVEQAYDYAWWESYQRKDDLPIFLVWPLGTWVWASGDLIPGPGFYDEFADFTDRDNGLPF